MAESKNRIPASGKIDGAAKKISKKGGTKATQKQLDKFASQKNGRLKMARFALKLAFKGNKSMRQLFLQKGESLTRTRYKGKDGKVKQGLGTGSKSIKQGYAAASLEQRAAASRFINTRIGSGKNSITIGEAFVAVKGKRGQARINVVTAAYKDKTKPVAPKAPKSKAGRGGRKPAAGNRGKPKTKK